MSEIWTVLKPWVSALGLPLAMTYGPTLYRALFQKRADVPIRPVPQHVANAQNILFIAAVFFLIVCFPAFAPENIYHKTSTIYTFAPTSDIFDRLADIRSPFTDFDQALKGKFGSKQCRMVYAAYGPDALANCPFCNCDSPSTYFYYSITSLLRPHLLNFIVLGAVTSLAQKEGMRWRTTAAMIGSVLTLVDLGILWNYEVSKNETKFAAEVDFVHWRLRTFRFASLFLFDVGFYGLLWATSTNRLLAIPPSISERLEEVTKGNEMLRRSMNNLIALRNTIMRDKTFRDRTVAYWSQEEQLEREIMEEPEVIEGVNDALTRLPVEDVRRIAGDTSGALFNHVDAMRQRRTAQ